MTALDRVFLGSAWRNLVALSYEADPTALGPLVPPGLELDLYDGRAYVSLVGFLFLDTAVLGVPIPFCRRFPEVNLRFYVRRRGPEGWRHGVVFVSELVPLWPIAAGARWLFGEPYRTVPMWNRLETEASGEPHVGGRLAYGWRSGDREHRLEARMAEPLQALVPGSREEFLVERHWGYTPRRGGALEYRVRRPPWRVAPAVEAVLDADGEALYGPVFGGWLAGPPSSALVADGSAVTVSFGARVGR